MFRIEFAVEAVDDLRKMISIPPESREVNDLLNQAREEEVVVRAADGAEFVISAVGDFDDELARTRANPELMALLEERAKKTETMSIGDVKRELGLD